MNLYKRGEALGVESHQIDGNNPLAVHTLVQQAAETCRAGRGPVLIEARTFRHMGHHVNDPGKYMPAERLAYYKERDPVDSARASLIDLSDASDSDVEAIKAAVDQEIADAVEFAKNSGEVTIEEFRHFAEIY